MFLELIRRRRSIRKYQPTPVAPGQLELLIEAALRAPSSRSLNPWEFVVVTDADMLEKLSESKKGAAFLKGAPCGIVVCADPDRSDIWIEDASIAATYIQLAAASLGLGSCWVQIRERAHTETESATEYVRKLLNIPDCLVVECIIAVGVPAEQPAPHAPESLEHHKVHSNTFP